MILIEEQTVKQVLQALVTYNAVAFSLNWESVNRVNKVISACELALKQTEEPNLSKFSPAVQTEVREWIADGTFVERAVDTMFELTKEVFALKKQLQAPPAIPEGQPLFYLQDTRGYVGNCPLWWELNGNGYTTDLRKAQKYTLGEAMAQHRCRESDLPWLCSEIDALQRPTIDAQDMHKLRSGSDQRKAMLAAAPEQPAEPSSGSSSPKGPSI